MTSSETTGALGAPFPEILRRARVEASGVSPALAASLIAIAFAMPKRDDLSLLSSITAGRCATAGAVCR